MPRKQIWLNPPLLKLLESCMNCKDEDNKYFSRRLGNIVARYEIIMNNTRVAGTNNINLKLMEEVISNNEITPDFIKKLHSHILRYDHGNFDLACPTALRIYNMSITERLKLIESLNH